jgi:hypothetical protein
MQCHACGHELAGTEAFCPNCGSKPMAKTEPEAAAGGDEPQAWVAQPGVAGDHKATVANMNAVAAAPAPGRRPAPSGAGAASLTPILIGVAILAGLAVAIYFLATF